MFDIEIGYEDIFISSVHKEDVPMIQNWMKEQMVQNPEDKWTNVDELDKRFLEYYISENEFFVKIIKEGNLIGVIKGRVVFKTPNDILLWCFVIDKDIRGQGIGSRILKEFIYYFKNSFGIFNFSTGVVEGSDRAIKFWNKNKFTLHRVSKNFFNDEGKEVNMLILRRNEKMV